MCVCVCVCVSVCMCVCVCVCVRETDRQTETDRQIDRQIVTMSAVWDESVRACILACVYVSKICKNEGTSFICSTCKFLSPK